MIWNTYSYKNSPPFSVTIVQIDNKGILFIMKYLILLLLIATSFTTLASTKIHIPPTDNPRIKIESLDKSTLFYDEQVILPWSFVEHAGLYSIPRDGHLLTIYGDSNYEQTYIIQAEQDYDVDIRSSSNTHNTHLPFMIQSDVVIKDHWNDEIIYQTKTDSNGNWRFGYTKDYSNLPEFVLIEVKNGRAMGYPRQGDNRMVALVETQDLLVGSVTVSLYTTAAYLALEQHKDQLIAEEFYELHEQNMMALTASGYHSSFPGGKALYLREPGMKANDFVYPTSIFADPVLPDGHSLWEAFWLLNADEQKEALSYYFARLNGWGSLPSSIRSISLSFRMFGEGQIFIDGNPLEMKSKLDEFSIYESSTLIIDRLSPPVITFEEQEGFAFEKWLGCNSEFGDSCKPAVGSGGVIYAIFSDTSANLDAPSKVSFSDNMVDIVGNKLVFKSDVAVGIARVYLNELDIDRNYTMRGKDWYRITDINIPSEDDPDKDLLSSYYAFVEELTHASSQSSFTSTSGYVTNQQYWDEMTDKKLLYKPNVALEIKKEGAALESRIAFVSSEDPNSTELRFGTIVEQYSESPGTVYQQSFSLSDESCVEATFGGSKKEGFAYSTNQGETAVKVCGIRIVKIKEDTDTSWWGAVEITSRHYDLGAKINIEGSSGFELSVTDLLSGIYISPYLSGKAIGAIGFKMAGTGIVRTISVLGVLRPDLTQVNVRNGALSVIPSEFKGEGAIEAGVGVFAALSKIVEVSAKVGAEGKAVAKRYDMDNLEQVAACARYNPFAVDLSVSAKVSADISVLNVGAGISTTLGEDFYNDSIVVGGDPDELKKCLSATLGISKPDQAAKYYKYANIEDVSAVVTISNESEFDANVELVPISNGSYFSVETTLHVHNNNAVAVEFTPNKEYLRWKKEGEYHVSYDVYSTFGSGRGIHARKKVGVITLSVDVDHTDAEAGMKNDYTKPYGISASIRYVGNGMAKVVQIGTPGRGGDSEFTYNTYEALSYWLNKVKSISYLGYRDVTLDDVELGVVYRDRVIKDIKVGDTFKLDNIATLHNAHKAKVIIYSKSSGTEGLSLSNLNGGTVYGVNIRKKIALSASMTCDTFGLPFVEPAHQVNVVKDIPLNTVRGHVEIKTPTYGADASVQITNITVGNSIQVGYFRVNPDIRKSDVGSDFVYNYMGRREFGGMEYSFPCSSSVSVRAFDRF